MAIDARFVHTSIVAREWRGLARLYQHVSGCIPISPERDLDGQWLTSATGVPEARIQGIHLRLPGHGDEGPTLEIFRYNRHEEA